VNSDATLLGVVEQGRFRLLEPAPVSPVELFDLTTMEMQVSVPPEMHQIDLTPYEGKAIMVQGHAGGGWIYSAAVIDEAGPILTALVLRVLGPASDTLGTGELATEE